MSGHHVEAEHVSVIDASVGSGIDVATLARSHYASLSLSDPVTLETRPFSTHFVHPIILRRSDASETPATLTDVFGSSSVKRVNIIGGPGVGKTACCQYLAQSWANGVLLPAFKAVLSVPLRNLTCARYPPSVSVSLTDIVIRECLGMPHVEEVAEDVSRMLADATSVLWILDGYDEIVGRVPEHLQPVVSVLLSSPRRVLTGRPNAMTRDDTDSDVMLRCDVEVEVVGLSDDSIHTAAGDAAFLDWLKRSKSTWTLAKLPLNLALLRHAFASKPESAVLSMSQLYHAVEGLFPTPSCDLASLAFQSLRHNTSPYCALPDSVDASESAFLLRSETDTAVFRIRTFQDYFAAKFAARLLSQSVWSDAGAKENLNWMLSHMDDANLTAVWMFVGDAVINHADATPTVLSYFDDSDWEKGRTCFLCDTAFSLMTRRHHCRACGRSTCDACSKSTLSRPEKRDEMCRVCDRCVSPAAIALSVTQDSLPMVSLQLLEYLVSNGVSNAFVRRVLSTLTHRVRDGLNPFVSTLNLCPTIILSIVFEWPVVIDALKSSTASEMVAKLPQHFPDVVRTFPSEFPAYIERLWKSASASSTIKAIILKSSIPFAELQWIVAEAATSLPSTIQDGLASVLREHPEVFHRPDVVAACNNTYLTSNALRRVYASHGELFTWLTASPSHVENSSSELDSVKIRQVATIDTDETDCNTGLAVSADGSVLAVSNERHDEITLYALPSGDKVRAFGDKGSEPGQFRNSLKLCFTPDNTLLVAEWKNKRVQEVTLTGEHRRFVGAGALSGDVVSVTCNSDVVVVGQSNDTQCISVFDYVTGDLLRGFGEQGRAVGKLQVPCGLQLSSDGRHVIVADSSNHNVSVFTLSGAFVGSFGSHSILTRPADVALMPCGDVVVCGHTSHRVAIFSPDGRRVKQFGAQGDGKGQFQHPTSVAVCGTRIYVLDNGSSRVQVFEYR